jgi:hypothetical protein
MKRLIALIICFACAGIAAAQTASLALANGEASWLYYALDPVFGTARSLPAGTGEAFTALDRVRFSALPPGGTLRLEGLAPGAHTVVGFWAADNVSSYAAFSFDVRLEAGQMRTYTLKKSSALASAEAKSTSPAAVKETLASTPILIDGDFSDWANYPAVAAFPPGAAPRQVTVQSPEGVRDLPIRNSTSWGRAGTRLLLLKALWRSEALYLYASASCSVEPGLSVFLYLFDDRQSAAPNQYTIEIPLTDESGRGDVLLWQRGVEAPATVGAFRFTGSGIEASIDFAKLPAALRDNMFDKYSFDLKTDYYDAARGINEEFYFTSIDCRDIYRQK